jgi:hypothetical protein
VAASTKLGGSTVQPTPRKRLFVDRHVQGALLFRIAIYWCFSVLTVCLVTLCFRAITYTGPVDSFFDYFAFGEFFSRYGVVLLASLVPLPLIMLDVLVTSNRFAGPLFRMRRSMRALAAGEHVRPIQFREKDFLQDLAGEFNAVARHVEQLHKELDASKRQAGKPQDFQPAAHE